MDRLTLAQRIAIHLDTLCNRIANRHTGNTGNRQATAFVRDTLASFGFEVECPEFPCIDWEGGKVQLWAADVDYAAHVGPYSLPFDGQALLEEASNLSDLEKKDINGKILLIHGDLASEPLFPKAFVFYNPEAHQKIIRLLEERKPLAIVAATGKHSVSAGALYPFPLFEDGDFDIPSVYIKDIDGVNLLSHIGKTVRLAFKSRRIPATGYNVIATMRGSGPERVVLTAHVDAKKGTPGALDDASGVAVLLAAGERLAQYAGKRTIEIAVLNGEDYFAASGEMSYLEANRNRWKEISLTINIDGAGYRDGNTSYSFYECPDHPKTACKEILSRYPGLVPGVLWYQGDHSMFVQQGVPALAFTSEKADYLSSEITHTEKDSVELIDPAKLAELASAVVECAVHLGA